MVPSEVQILLITYHPKFHATQGVYYAKEPVVGRQGVGTCNVSDTACTPAKMPG